MLRRRFMSVVSTLVVVLLAGSPVAGRAAGLSEKDALALGVDAYIYGYPADHDGVHAPGHHQRRWSRRAPTPRWASSRTLREYPNAAFRDVTAPNADTLYSSAFLDLSKEPYVLSAAGRGGPLLPDADARPAGPTCSRCPASAPPGPRPQTYAITGPGWKGTLPAGVKELKSPTAMVWILGRTYCTGTPEDYKAVHALQDKYKLVPLTAYGKPYTPPPGKIDPSDRHEDAPCASR